MAADLTGLTPGGTDATFKWLAHFGANGAFPADGGTPQILYKGDGTPSPLSFTATKAFVNGNEIFSGDPAIKEDKQPASLAVTDETTFNESYLNASAFGTIVEPDALVQYIYLPAGASGDVRKSLTIRAPHGEVYIYDGDGSNYLGLVAQGAQQRFRAASWDGGLSHLRYEPVGIFGAILEAVVNAMTVISGAKAFSGQVSLTGQTAFSATAAMTRALSDARYLGQRLPLLDWAFSGWSGSGVVGSRGAAALNMTLTGATVIEGSDGYGRLVSFSDIGLADASALTDRLHDGLDFTLLLEGEDLGIGTGSAKYVFATATTSTSSTGIISYAESGQFVFGIREGAGFPYSFVIPFTGTLAKVVIARNGTMMEGRITNTAGGVFTSAPATAASAAPAVSSYAFSLFRNPAGTNSYNPAKCSRVRIWDTYINPALL
jgi:hypothetical protein